MLIPIKNLVVRESDSSPKVLDVREIVLPNGSLTDNGSGTITLSFTNGAAGSNGEVQYNNGGAFAGASGIIYSTSSPNVSIISQGAAHIPLIVKGASSQSVNLTEWQNNSGIVLSKVKYDGRIVIGATDNNQSSFEITTFSGFPYAARINGASLIGGTLEFSSSGGYLQFDAAASIRYLSSISFLNNSGTTTLSDDGTTGLIIGSSSSSNVALRIKGASVQTGNLLEFQDSSANVMTRILSSGYMDFGQISNVASGFISIRHTGSKFGLFRGTLDHFCYYNTMNGDTVLDAVFGGAGVSLQTAGSEKVRVTNAGQLLVNGFSSSTTGFVVKAAASQNANLQEWQDSVSAILGSVSGKGDKTISPAVRTTGSPTLLTVTGPAHTTLTASTEATDINFNLARTVQFSAGALGTQRAILIQQPTYSFVSASTLTNAVTMEILGGPVTGTNATITNSYALRVLSGQATVVPLVLKGASSQTANLQEWQNSGGTVLANITSGGIFTGDGSGLTTLNASNLSSGTVNTARLGSGTADSTKFLRGDSTWQTIPSGSVISVAATAPAAGFTISGSPITSSGTFVFTLSDDLAAIEGLSGTGIAVRTASNTWTTRAIASGSGISIADGDGISGNPTITNTGVTSLTGTANQISVSASTGSVTLTTPQNIHSAATPTFAQITISNTPSNSTDVATKGYVDNLVTGLDIKNSCRVATTANITLSNTQTIDGVSVVAGNRVLVKNQTTGSENGIYVCVSGGAWTRATDADQNAEVTCGLYTFIEEGTANGSSGWILTTNDPITVGSTSLTFTQFNGLGQIAAGAGLTKTGNTLDVGTASSSRIVVNADNIDLATTGVSASTYKSVTVDVYGRVTAGTNPTTLSGYGITDAQPLDSTLTSLASYNTNGLLTQTAADTFTGRTIIGTTNRLSVSNGDGVSGNPTLDISTNYVGQSSITTLGTISSGTWNGTLIGVGYGGTGTSTQFTAGSVIFAGASGVYSENNSKLFWDNTNNRLGLGTTGPSAKLHIASSVADAWIIGGTANGNYATMLFGEGVGAGQYAEFIRYSNATTGASKAGNFVIANLNKDIIFSTAYTSDYRQDLVIKSTGFIGIGTASPSADLHLVGTVKTTGSPNTFIITGAAHTTLTASTEAVDIDLALNRTVQFTTGALTTQRSILIRQPTYGFVAASTLTTAATVEILGGPIAGTNATITNSYALRVLAGQATAIPLVLKGASSQTANLQEWQNSSGSLLSFIDSSGKINLPNTGLRIADTNASHYLSIVPGSNITADRTLTLTTGDTDKTLTINSDATVSSNTAIATITFVIDGGGATIATGVKGDLEIPFDCTINRVTLLGDQSGSIVVDIFKCTYSQYDAGATHPVSGDKITASAPPTISSATKSQDSTLTGWTTSINAGDILRFNVNSVTTLQRVVVSLKVTKT